MTDRTIKSILNPALSKRTFLTGAGATAAMALSTQTMGSRKAIAQNAKWDLIVVGGGTAGMPAALFAADRGAKVLLIDIAPQLGGTMDRSQGQVAAAGTVWQKEQGIEDSPDAHYEDVMRINRHTSDPRLTRLLVDNAADTLNWFAARGYKVHDDHPVKGGGHEAFLTRRYQWSPDRARAFQNIMDPMITTAQSNGNLTVLLDTGAVDIIQDESGAVTGVVTENDSGERMDYRSSNVLLTSGGCASNPRLFETLHGVPLFCEAAYPYSQGQGIMLGVGAGGYVRNRDKYAVLFGTVLESEYFPAPAMAGAMLSPQRRQPWEVYVNVHGKRFIREDEPSVAQREYTLGLQPGMRHWAVFDQEVFDNAPPFLTRMSREDVEDAFVDHPMFSKADTLGGVAVKAGVNPRNLAQEIENYNDAVLNDRTDAWGREHRPLPIAKPPFYAIRLQGWNVMSYAGLAVNGDLQVVREDGTAIPNLYAAGEVIGNASTSGQALTNGMGVTPALTFGRLLGQRIIPLRA